MMVRLVAVVGMLVACVSDDSSECTIDDDCKGERVCSFAGVCEEPAPKKACGEIIAVCGCYGLTPGQTVGATGCSSGRAQVESCSAACGFATQNRCYCN